MKKTSKYEKFKNKAEKDLDVFTAKMQKKYEPIIEKLVKQINLEVFNSQMSCTFVKGEDRDFINDKTEDFKHFLHFIEDDLRLSLCFKYKNGVFEWLN